MKIVFALAASTLIANVILPVTSQGDTESLYPNNDSLPNVRKNSLPHEALSHDIGFQSKINSAYNNAHQTKEGKVAREAQSCTVCEDGSSVPESYAQESFQMFDGTMTTCEEFGVDHLPNMFTCAEPHWYGYAYCGCPTISSVCTPCAGGDNILRPDDLFDEAYGDTCADEVAFVVRYLFPADSFCEEKQKQLSQKCGCPCTLCADGSQVSPEFLGQQTYDGDTCGEHQENAPSLSGEDCVRAQVVGNVFCGCETLPEAVEDGCSACADGFDLFPDAEFNDYDHITCDNYNQALSAIKGDSSDCFWMRFFAVEESGCCQKRCTVCADGLAVSPEYLDVDLYRDDTWFDGDWFFQRDIHTCTDLQIFYEENVVYESWCSVDQLNAWFECGCPTGPDPVEGGCSLCPDGKVLDPDIEHGFSGKTCKDVSEAFSGISEVACEGLRKDLRADDCCVAPKCTLCADGSEVLPEYLNRVGLPSKKCSELQMDLVEDVFPTAFIDNDGDVCSAVQMVGWFYCGCPTGPDPVEDGCSLCPDGKVLDPDKGVACKDLSEAMLGLSSNGGDCNAYRGVYSNDYCCMPSSPSPTRSPAPSTQSHKPSPTPGPTQSPTQSPTPSPTQSPTPSPTLSQSPAPSDGGKKCNICADGSQVSPEYIDVELLAFDCGEANTYFELYGVDEGSLECVENQVVGWFKCGCPTYPDPVEDSCPFCRFDVFEIVPDREIDDSDKTCEEASEAIAAIPKTGISCGYMQDVLNLGNRCCIRSSTQSPTQSPTPSPTLSPTQSPTQNDNLTCTLCADRSIMDTNYNKEKVFGLRDNCKKINQKVANFSGNYCIATQVAGFLYCGCPSYPLPVEDGCSICPDGFDIDSDREAGDSGKMCKEFIEPFLAIKENSDVCKVRKNFMTNLGCCISDTLPTMSPTMGPSLTCTDQHWRQFSIQKGKVKEIKTCTWLNTLSESEREDICLDSEVYGKCPSSCSGACPCRDKKYMKFRLKNEREKFCMWLSRLKKKNLKVICRLNSQAMKKCPDTCAGWCRF